MKNMRARMRDVVLRATEGFLYRPWSNDPRKVGEPKSPALNLLAFVER